MPHVRGLGLAVRWTARPGAALPALRRVRYGPNLTEGDKMSKHGDRSRAADKEHRRLTSEVKKVPGQGNKPDDRLLKDRGEAATRRQDHKDAARIEREGRAK